MLRALLQTRRTYLGEENYQTAEARGLLAAALAQAGQRDAALREFRAALAVLLAAAQQGELPPPRAFRLSCIVEQYLALLSTAASADQDSVAESFAMAELVRSGTVHRTI